MKTFLIKTFGCKVNQYESQAIREKFISAGYVDTVNNSIPSICIINTCCVTQNAERKSRQFLNRVKRIYPDSKIIVTGCSVNFKPENFKDAEFLIPNEKKDSIVYAVLKRKNKNVNKSRTFHRGSPNWKDMPISFSSPQQATGFSEKVRDKGISGFSEHTRAFVKIQDGCNQFCSYCIVPYVRGRSRSRDFNEIVDEIQILSKNGYKEIVLTGIHIGDFDKFGELLDIANGLENIFRIRLSSIEPQEVDDDLIKAVLRSKKVCRHFHIPLQSGSDSILKAMNRTYLYSDYRKLIEKIREKMPEVIFTTDVIVGFPGEAKEDFKLTCNAVNEIGFSKVHIFPYSKRSGTKAAGFTGTVSKDEITRRVKILKKEADDLARKVRGSFIGTIQEVMVESAGRGYTEGYIPVIIKGHTVPNTFVKIKITGQDSNYLVGEILLES